MPRFGFSAAIGAGSGSAIRFDLRGWTIIARGVRTPAPRLGSMEDARNNALKPIFAEPLAISDGSIAT